jgi:DNA mismatch endonuclease, patch repair protein
MQRKFNTSAHVSKIMASIRSKETWPEMWLRKNLWRQGLRNYRKYPNLPGHPDLCFPTHRLVIFVDGCFWHGCPLHCRIPKKNLDYWMEKIAYNKVRDERINEELQKKGFAVLRFWEHDIKEDVFQAVGHVKRLVDDRLNPKI